MKKILGNLFSTGMIREPEGWIRKLTLLLVCAITIFQFYVVLFSTMDPFLHNSIFITFMLAVTFIVFSFSSGKSRNKIPLYDILISFTLMGIGVFMIVYSERFLTRWPMADPLTVMEMIVGSIMLLIVIEVTRRTLGTGMLVIVSALIIYAFFGHLIPGVFGHQQYTLMQFVDQMVFTVNGVYGSIATVAATYVFFFVLFGNLFNASGGGNFFYALSKAVTGRVAGGPAKVAVISSGLYGSISGSPTADVATTGSFTIPSMKKVGYSGVYAGAIEATAATGGSILPPVMGSAAFLMAEMTGISYASIAWAALIPGLLYYLAIFAQVHFQAKKTKMAGYDDETLPTVKGVMKSMGQFIIPIIVLVVFLEQGFTPVLGAIAASVATIIVSYFKKETRLTPKKLFNTMIETTTRISPLVAVCAAAGIVAGVIQVTGLGGKFSSLIHAASGGSIFMTLLVTMVVCVIFGMGMPTPAAYILTAVLAAPIMIEVGIDLLEAHLFILYFACLSAITPPVAVAAYAAAAIADANPIKIGLLACRLGAVAFIIPFMFIYDPALLLIGSPVEIIIAVISAIIGVLALAAGFEGWFGIPLKKYEQFIVIISGLLLIYPHYVSSIIGLAGVCFMLVPKFPEVAKDFKNSGRVKIDGEISLDKKPISNY
ncbi:C4-dicarboxylate ABC transporter [Bacillus canaveralius]|uniref:C4-dicarboxylate ABC transporter n=1 Tax=Bacillus canaveralius TaxID=1403243 RepID=A0A2N5GMU9_9BACI|nr:TRAP transporter fused permease subunit [Bacillus canaveralius]PLR83270.1 C4-dicarboxylate ABC transporter [Bacillus canaveralius]PLR96683.1 C4-dicarboxylate ABC transporter [Bacillus canaveralius]RSK55237.1 TRAP transporter fused permease subunit [Bacillus canaveralius]